MPFPVVTPEPGVARQVLTDDPALMTVSVRFETGAGAAPPHRHPHVQSTFVRSGRFVFTLGDETREVGPGDSLLIPSGLPHGCRCIEAGELIDAFAPRRDDFL